MFNGCTSLQSINVSSFSVSTYSSLNGMFANCTSLTDLNLSNWNVYNASFGMGEKGMFYNCAELKNFKAPKSINSNIDFSTCPKLTRDSLLSIINNLVSWAGTSSAGSLTLTLGETNLAKLTASDKAKVTNKGWSLK
jgi:surface protein